MKFTIIFCTIAAAAMAVKNQEIMKLPPEILNKMNNIALPCAQKFNIDPANIPKLSRATLTRDEASNKFLYCFAVNGGYVDIDGHIALEKVSRAVRNHPRLEEFIEAVNKCNLITKENPIATTIAMNDCFAQNSPVVFSF